MPEVTGEVDLDEVGTVEVTLDVSVYCGTCGAGLCRQSEGNARRGGYWRAGQPTITVDVCEKCREEARAEGYDDGYADGAAKGYDDGYADGARETEEAMERG